jgi:hypothetical protein
VRSNSASDPFSRGIAVVQGRLLGLRWVHFQQISFFEFKSVKIGVKQLNSFCNWTIMALDFHTIGGRPENRRAHFGAAGAPRPLWRRRNDPHRIVFDSLKGVSPLTDFRHGAVHEKGCPST